MGGGVGTPNVDSDVENKLSVTGTTGFINLLSYVTLVPLSILVLTLRSGTAILVLRSYVQALSYFYLALTAGVKIGHVTCFVYLHYEMESRKVLLKVHSIKFVLHGVGRYLQYLLLFCQL